jgi:uncharacterized protein
MTGMEREALVRYKIGKAQDTLNEVPLHIQNELWTTAVNRLYYSCFYAVSALLLNNEIYSKTHSGTKQMFGLHFIKSGIISERSGDFYTVIFDMRLNGDYEDFIVFDRDEVVALLQPATDLIAEIEAVLSKQ